MTFTAVDQTRESFEAIPAMQAVVEGVIDQLHERGSFGKGAERGRIAALETGQHDPAWSRNLGRTVDVRGRGPDVSYGSLQRVVNDLPDDGLRPEYSDQIDRFILEADWPRYRNDGYCIEINDRQFIGQQSPPPRNKSCAKRALARARRRGKKQSAPVTLDHRRVDDQILMAVRGDRPVQTPLEQGKCLVARERLERRCAIEMEYRFWADPATNSPSALDRQVEIGEGIGRDDLMRGVVEIDAPLDDLEGGSNRGNDWSDTDPET